MNEWSVLIESNIRTFIFKDFFEKEFCDDPILNNMFSIVQIAIYFIDNLTLYKIIVIIIEIDLVSDRYFTGSMVGVALGVLASVVLDLFVLGLANV